MVSTEYRGAGKSPYETATSYAQTSAERAAWQFFAPLVADKKGVWIDPSQDRFYRRLAADDSPSLAKILDRCGDRLYTSEPTLNRHPIVVEDDITGRDVFMFGAGGASPNALTASANGVMICADGVDAHGVGDNNPSVWNQGVGFSVAWKARLPEVSGTSNGVTFSTSVGGGIFGQGQTQDNVSYAWVGTGLSSGFASIRTRDTDGSNIGGSVDLRDDLWHDYVATYNRTTTTLRMWVDGVALTPNTNATIDVYGGTNAGKVWFAGAGRLSGGPAARFIGFMAFAAWMQGPVLEDSVARGALRSLMATR